MVEYEVSAGATNDSGSRSRVDVTVAEPVLTRSDDRAAADSGGTYGLNVLLGKAKFNDLDLAFDDGRRIMRGTLRPVGLPCISRSLLDDMREAQRLIQNTPAEACPRYFTCASAAPGVFNLGGDLKLFAQMAKRQMRHELLEYGLACVEVLYTNYVAMRRPMITLALVQGAALGGGFEAVLSFDYIVAERSARFGLPEVMFNMFPGMGGVSFLSRRVGRRTTDEIINSGRIFTAEELHGLGLVDVVADDGQGEEALADLIDQIDTRFNARRAVLAARRRINPLDLGELRDVVSLWVDAILDLSPADLRKMERISAAQDRRIGWTSGRQGRKVPE